MAREKNSGRFGKNIGVRLDVQVEPIVEKLASGTSAGQRWGLTGVVRDIVAAFVISGGDVVKRYEDAAQQVTAWRGDAKAIATEAIQEATRRARGKKSDRAKKAS